MLSQHYWVILGLVDSQDINKHACVFEVSNFMKLGQCCDLEVKALGSDPLVAFCIIRVKDPHLHIVIFLLLYHINVLKWGKNLLVFHKIDNIYIV